MTTSVRKPFPRPPALFPLQPFRAPPKTPYIKDHLLRVPKPASIIQDTTSVSPNLHLSQTTSSNFHPSPLTLHPKISTILYRQNTQHLTMFHQPDNFSLTPHGHLHSLSVSPDTATRMPLISLPLISFPREWPGTLGLSIHVSALMSTVPEYLGTLIHQVCQPVAWRDEFTTRGILGCSLVWPEIRLKTRFLLSWCDGHLSLLMLVQVEAIISELIL